MAIRSRTEGIGELASSTWAARQRRRSARRLSAPLARSHARHREPGRGGRGASLALQPRSRVAHTDRARTRRRAGLGARGRRGRRWHAPEPRRGCPDRRRAAGAPRLPAHPAARRRSVRVRDPGERAVTKGRLARRRSCASCAAKGRDPAPLAARRLGPRSGSLRQVLRSGDGRGAARSARSRRRRPPAAAFAPIASRRSVESLRARPPSAARLPHETQPDRRSRRAEGVGFEPTVRSAHNGFRDRPIRPLSHPSGGRG